MEKLEKRVQVEKNNYVRTLLITFSESANSISGEWYDTVVQELDCEDNVVDKYYTAIDVGVFIDKKDKYRKAFVAVSNEYLQHIEEAAAHEQSLENFHKWDGIVEFA